MSATPIKALLVCNERKDFWRLQKTIADVGPVDFRVIESEHLESTLQQCKAERLDVILVDPDQTAARLVNTVVRARDHAPGVAVLVLPETHVGPEAALLLRQALERGAGPAGRGSEAVSWAVRCTDRLRQVEQGLLRLALRDDLTGLYNRRGFSIIADEYRRMACQMKKRLMLLFADLDNLKQINDQFGHAEGDQALIRTAASFKTTFRGSDVIARFGGDEFTALVVERARGGVEAVCGRLRRNLACTAASETRYRLSLSIGVARFDPDQAPSLQELVGEADEALYQQKHQKKSAFLPVSVSQGI
ncbi:MAG TPA: diguanylate cyclase [Steroidobacteraceae bacterium]|nr:diguanylate cyclase [Steroidobacteraceae bacterium]